MAESVWEDIDSWHELMSSDPGVAESFYREVVGLSPRPLEGGPFPYTLWVQDGRPVGGLIPPMGAEGWPSGNTPHWVVSFRVPDVEQSAAKTQELGGDILVPPTSIPAFGKAAVLRDAEGAVFGVFEKA